MTPLVLLAGFLGSGKTTFLRRLLPELTALGVEPHVIINDYQNAAVDAALLREVTNAVVPISGSCVCCGSREELIEALVSLAPGPRGVVLIETNGTTDTQELIELLSWELRLRRFTLPWQVTLVDAKRWQKRYWHNPLEREQVGTATHVVITRLDQVSAERRTAVEQSLTEIAARALATAPDVFARELNDLVAAVAQRRPRLLSAENAPSGSGEEHDHAARHHFASLEIPLPALVERTALTDFLRGLPEGVLRAKGVAVLRDAPGRTQIFQRAGPEDGILFTTLRGPAPVAPVLILIGVNLPEADLRTRVTGLA